MPRKYLRITRRRTCDRPFSRGRGIYIRLRLITEPQHFKKKKPLKRAAQTAKEPTWRKVSEGKIV